MRALRGLWRWRGNPLRRTTDLTEACLALVAALVIVVVAPTAGWWAGSATHDALMRTVRVQQAERHRVVATVVRVVGHARYDPDPETAPQGGSHRRVLAVWTAPDGRRHSGVVAGHPNARRHSRFHLWTDRHGHPVPRPLDSLTATAHGVLAGLGTGAATALLVEGGRRLALWRLMRRRYRRWDAAWAEAGQDWGRTGAGS